MGIAENKQLLKDAFAGLAGGNRRALLDVLADDVEWTVIGATKLSGTFRGKQALIEEVFIPMTAALAEQVTLTAESFIGEGDYVVVQLRGRAKTKTGVRYDNVYCWVCRFAHGRIAALTEYVDTELVTAAFGR